MKRQGLSPLEKIQKGAVKKKHLQDDAGILTAGKARVRRISAWICNERATPPAAKRTSQVVNIISRRLLSRSDSVQPRMDADGHGGKLREGAFPEGVIALTGR